MRYATTPGWVYVMLIVMGLGFMGGAVAFILFVPQPTGMIVGAIWLVMGFCFVFFSIRALRGRKDDERIRREGTAATATLLAANTTGMVINNVPQWKLSLRIDGAGASYEATMKLCTYTPPANGATFTVRIDPVRREHVVLADDGTPAPSVLQQAGQNGATASAAETVRLLADLDRMHASGTIGDADFDALKRKLLGGG